MGGIPHGKRSIGTWLLAALALAALAGCAARPRAQPDAAQSLDAPIAFARDAVAELPQTPTYRIGINTEVTGTGAQIGDLSIRAARLAVEEINAAGGVRGVPIELVVRDCRSSPAAAVEQYRQAIADDRLVALLGPLKSAYAAPILPEHRRTTLPMLIGATNYHLTEQGDEHLFRMRPSDRLTAAAMVTLAVDRLGARRIGIVHDADAFGSGGAERVVAELERRGMALVARERYVTGESDFDPLVRRMAAAGVDTILIYGTNSTDVGVLLRAIRYWHLQVQIVTSPGGASTVTRNVAAEAQDGVYVATDALLSASPIGVHFEQAFARRFGMPPDTYIAWYYDAIYLLAGVLREHGAAPQALDAAIRATVYQGAQGVYRFDAAGEGLHQVALVRMDQGHSVPVGSYDEHGLVEVRGQGSGVRGQGSGVRGQGFILIL
ncbi:MAG TPA: ABC transporter substrate-binding protein [Roseiflexaceae bacterium]